MGASSYWKIGAGGWGAISWGPENFMTLGPDCTDSSLFQKQCRGGYKSRYTTKLLERGYCKLVFTTRRSVSVYTEKITSQDSNHDDICAVANCASLVDAHPVRNLSSRYSKTHESTTLLIALNVVI